MCFIPLKTQATSVCGSALVCSTQGSRYFVYFLISEALASWSRNRYSRGAVFIGAAEQAGGCYLPVSVGSVELGRVRWFCRQARTAFAFATLSFFYKMLQ